MFESLSGHTVTEITAQAGMSVVSLWYDSTFPAGQKCVFFIPFPLLITRNDKLEESATVRKIKESKEEIKFISDGVFNHNIYCIFKWWRMKVALQNAF